MKSAAYRLAALDEEFMLSDSMRGVRFLLEYAGLPPSAAARFDRQKTGAST